VDPSSCVILVPVGGPIVPGCEQALQTLERRGDPARRLPGVSAIDFGHCVMASDALRAGFQELMWSTATSPSTVRYGVVGQVNLRQRPALE
jgi:hypothetical protein